MNSLLQSNCVNAAAAGNSQNSLTLRCDCVTAAAPSLGPYDCVWLPGLYGWATVWLLLLYWGRMTALCCPDLSDYGRLRDCCCCYRGRMTAFCVRDYRRLRDCCCCFIGAVWLRYVVQTMGDCVTAAAASLGPYDCVLCSGLKATAWLLLCLIGAVWRRSGFGTMGDCVTAAAASLGPYDCAMLFGLWPTAWLLLLLHWGRMTALCCMDYGRLRDCCCCFIRMTAFSVRDYGRLRNCCCCFIAVWLCSVFGTMGDCVTAVAASLGPYDCAMLFGLWPTAWLLLLLLLHWGRMTALCCLDYGRLRDCCCCFIGAVWRRSVFGTMGDCVTAAVASLGPNDCVQCSGLWATAWLLLLLHWGRMTAICWLDYGRLRDCCCCFIGAVWLRYVGWTMGDCVTAAAACDVSGMLAKTGHHCGADAADIGTEAVWPHNWWLTAVRTAWLLLLLSQWGQPDGRVLYGNRDNIVKGAATAWVMLLPAWDSLCAVFCLVCVTDAAAALGAGRVGSVGDNCTGVKLLLTHCACSSVPHAAAALCSRIWWNFRVRRFGVDLSWRIDRHYNDCWCPGPLCRLTISNNGTDRWDYKDPRHLDVLDRYLRRMGEKTIPDDLFQRLRVLSMMRITKKRTDERANGMT